MGVSWTPKTHVSAGQPFPGDEVTSTKEKTEKKKIEEAGEEEERMKEKEKEGRMSQHIQVQSLYNVLYFSSRAKQ